MQTHIRSQCVIHTVLTISHFFITPQPQACAHEYTVAGDGTVKQTSTDQHKTTHARACTHTNTIATPPFIQTISHLPTLPQPIWWQKKKKNTSPCSVADSECIKASNSLKMRKFSWGYWISPSSLCSVVSLTYMAKCRMDQTLRKGTTERQVL